MEFRLFIKLALAGHPLPSDKDVDELLRRVGIDSKTVNLTELIESFRGTDFKNMDTNSL